MENVDPDSISPIVILGTGRCGSTYLQTMLCGVSDIWIWGEHDGILEGFFRWSSNARNSDLLNRFSFPFVEESPYTTIKRDGTRAAWLSPFGLDDITDLERDAVNRLFSLRMPDGKSRWGFKEIRYGAGSVVPQRMLTLFPRTKFIHVVRDPHKTISSSIRAWNREVFDIDLDEESRKARIRELVSKHALRWKETTRSLEGFSAENPEAMMTVKIENASEETSAILSFLNANSVTSDVDVVHESNPAIQDVAVSGLIEMLIDDATRRDSEFLELTSRLGY